MSFQEPEILINSDETTTLLVEGVNNIITKMQKVPSQTSGNGPLTSQQSLQGIAKPMLMRQDRAMAYITSPQLSGTGINIGLCEENYETKCDEKRSNSYQLMPSVPTNRCRTCRTNERRSSVSPTSRISLPRSVSKDSVVIQGRNSPHLVVHHQSTIIPPVLITGSPTKSSRMIRQSSQPESSTLSCCGSQCTHQHPNTTASLRQLKETSDGISGIAADALRVRFIDIKFLKNYLLIIVCFNRLMEQCDHSNR